MCKLKSSLYARNLSESTCCFFFETIKKLENYKEILNNLNILSVILDIFLILEKIIVFNWSTNSLLGAFLIKNKIYFERILNFGKDEEKLSILIFEDKIEIKEDDNIQIELSEKEEDFLEELKESIELIRNKYEFYNLELFLEKMFKNLENIEKNEKYKNMSILKICEFLKLYNFSNFFKQNQNLINVNFLNSKDDYFILRFNSYIMKNCIEKFVGFDFKDVYKDIEEYNNY